MYKFIKLRDHDNDFDKSTISFEVDAICRNELIEEFECFLRACGFHINGTLEIEESESSNVALPQGE